MISVFLGLCLFALVVFIIDGFMQIHAEKRADRFQIAREKAQRNAPLDDPRNYPWVSSEDWPQYAKRLRHQRQIWVG